MIEREKKVAAREAEVALREKALQANDNKENEPNTKTNTNGTR